MFSKATLLLVALSALELSVSALPSDHIRRSHGHIGKRTTSSPRAKRSSCKARPTSSVALSAVSSGAAQASTTSAASSAKFTTSAAASSSYEAESSSSASSSKAKTSSAAKSSSAKASATSSASKSSPSGSIFGELMDFLFPSGGTSSSKSSAWTTAPQLADALPLADSTFGISKDMSELSHDYVNSPDGSQAMQVIYKEGSYQLSHAPYGGVSFYATGPSDVDLTTAKEATFGYSIWFEDGFEFQLGGKLPGLYGGNDADTAVSCSGGRRSDECFSARLMWRTDGAGELYTYLPPSYSANDNVCDVPPYSTCNPTYGASVGRGSYTFKTGAWNTVTQRVKLNDVGSQNGELQLYVNGNSVINVGGLVLRDSSAGKIWGIQMQSFFGGSTSDYASPKTQNAYFKDFTTAILDTL